MADLFHFVGKPYNVRNNLIIKGKQTAQFILEQKVYILLLQNYGNQFQAKLKAQNCQIFLKKKKKPWTTNKCPCRVCKTYVGNIGFI